MLTSILTMPTAITTPIRVVIRQDSLRNTPARFIVVLTGTERWYEPFAPCSVPMSSPGIWGFPSLHHLDGGDGFLRGAESTIPAAHWGIADALQLGRVSIGS